MRISRVVHLIVVMAFVHISTVFAQVAASPSPCKPIKIENLTKEILPMPEQSGRKGAFFFSMSIQSISQASIDLYDDKKNLTSSVIINSDPIARTSRFGIQSQSGTLEWVAVRYSENANKITAKITTSSGQAREFLFAIVNDDHNKKKIKSISLHNGEERDNNVNSLSESIKTASTLSDELLRLERELYDTESLKELHSVLNSLDVLQRIVLQSSPVPDFVEEPEGIPDCYVACQRIGTIVPIYACNDDVLGCERCGVDGFYYLDGFGCVIWCVLHCRSFYS